jgi:phosphatidylserine/phosphatidylglycerophosphate/cardiolipin synthase-like enzyme
MKILMSMRIYVLLAISVVVFAVGIASVGADEIQLIRKERLESVIDQYVRGSESRLWVAHYIIYDQAPAMNFLANLVERSRAGVDVKLIIDGIGPGPFLPISRKVFNILIAAGVEVRIFHSKKRHFHKLPKRMHEKIVLADDVAVIGSSSIWQPSFYCHLWEADAVLQGDVLLDIEEDFMSIWRSKALSAVKPSRRSASVLDFDAFILKYRHGKEALGCETDFFVLGS